MPRLTLYIGNKNYSSWSLRGWLALKLADLSFEEVVIPLRRPETVETIGRISPSGMVPTLHWHPEDGAGPPEIIWDSIAIFETLAERLPDRALWPADPAARAHARAICAEMHAGFLPLRRQLPMNLRRRPSPIQPDGDCGADIARVLEIWADCRRRFAAESDQPFLFGAPTLADAAFAPVATRLRTYQIGMDDLTADYVRAIHEWSFVNSWTQDAIAEPWRIESMEV